MIAYTNRNKVEKYPVYLCWFPTLDIVCFTGKVTSRGTFVVQTLYVESSDLLQKTTGIFSESFYIFCEDIDLSHPGSHIEYLPSVKRS